jgi:RNA polymerase sigma factor for flagellar operon FliA
MTDLNEALWERYRVHGDSEARSQLLDRYIGLVHHAAREIIRRAPREIELDELVSAGTLGLVQALEGFELERRLAFSSYAVPRIRGAMLDEMRAQDWVPRSVRTRSRQLSRVRDDLAQRLGRAPVAAEVARALDVDMDTYWHWSEQAEGRVLLALDAPGGTGEEGDALLSETIPDTDSVDPGVELARAETLQALHEAFAGLPAKDRLVLSLYHYEQLSLKEIGDVLHVSESRVSQIRTRALRRLREAITRNGGEP